MDVILTLLSWAKIRSHALGAGGCTATLLDWTPPPVCGSAALSGWVMLGARSVWEERERCRKAGSEQKRGARERFDFSGKLLSSEIRGWWSWRDCVGVKLARPILLLPRAGQQSWQRNQRSSITGSHKPSCQPYRWSLGTCLAAWLSHPPIWCLPPTTLKARQVDVQCFSFKPNLKG